MKGLTMLSLNKSEKKVSTWDKHSLDSYLAGAVVLMDGKTKAEAEKIAENYVRTTDRDAIREGAVDLKAAELKKEAKQYGLREKLNYATDADHDLKLEMAVIGAASLVESLAKSEAMPNGPVAMVVPKNAVRFAVGSMVKSDTPEKRMKADEYANIKHTQLVLKQLKRCLLVRFDPNSVEKTEKKSMMQEAMGLYASYGNPSGGMAHKDMPAEKSAAEPAAKAEPAKEGKKTLWQEAKEMYASYGNPSGGMAHKDMPAEKPAAEPAAKAEPAKEGKKSMWEEAMEMYASYGNPSGGMTHKDMPAEKPAAEPVAKAEPAKEGKKSMWKEAMEMYATYGNPSGGMTHKDTPAKKDDAGKAVVTAVANRARQR